MQVLKYLIKVWAQIMNLIDFIRTMRDHSRKWKTMQMKAKITNILSIHSAASSQSFVCLCMERKRETCEYHQVLCLDGFYCVILNIADLY